MDQGKAGRARSLRWDRPGGAAGQARPTGHEEGLARLKGASPWAKGRE